MHVKEQEYEGDFNPKNREIPGKCNCPQCMVGLGILIDIDRDNERGQHTLKQIESDADDNPFTEHMDGKKFDELEYELQFEICHAIAGIIMRGQQNPMMAMLSQMMEAKGLGEMPTMGGDESGIVVTDSKEITPVPEVTTPEADESSTKH